MLAVAIAWVFPRAQAEVAIAFFPVSTAIIWFGRSRARRRSDSESLRYRIGRTAAMVAVIGVTCCSGAFYLFAVDSQPFTPSSSELLPLPDGLQATSNVAGHGYCGTGVCTRQFTVEASHGQSPEEARDEVRQHLSRKGWKLDVDGQDCRPAGLLIDQRTICVGLYLKDGIVTVAFDGNQAWA